jgi:hypothetical protein
MQTNITPPATLCQTCWRYAVDLAVAAAKVSPVELPNVKTILQGQADTWTDRCQTHPTDEHDAWRASIDIGDAWAR